MAIVFLSAFLFGVLVAWAKGPGAVSAVSEVRMPMVVRLVPGWGLSNDASAVSMAVYTAEFILGLGLVLLAARRAPRSLRAS